MTLVKEKSQPFARLGIRKKGRHLANHYQFNFIEYAKSWRFPKDLANPDLQANPYLANPFILANYYVLENNPVDDFLSGSNPREKNRL